MRENGKRCFRKRLLSLLLCAAVGWQSFSPAAGSLVYAAESPDLTSGTVADAQPALVETQSDPAESQPVLTETQSALAEVAAGQGSVAEEAAKEASEEAAPVAAAPEEEAPEETAGDSDSFYVDPNEVAPGSQDAENYFTPEEIAGAEAYYQIEEEEEPVYSEEEIRAEEEEKARRDAEEQKTKVDDSYKLEDSQEEDEEGEEAAGKTVERDCSALVGRYYSSIKPSEMIKKAAAENVPITLYGPLEVVKTLSVPKKKTVTIYLNGYNISGIKDILGSNAVFKVEEGATLKLIGDDNPNYVKNRLVNGGNGFVIAKKKSNLYLKNVKLMNNHSYTNGGGIYLGEKVNCELYNARIDENKAENCGGGIYVAGAQTNISLDQYTSIDRNKAKYGGGVYINKSKVNIYAPATGKTQVQGNEAKSGGGLYLNNTDISVAGLKIVENMSTDSEGGGVRMEKTKTSLANCLITKNLSRTNGGGVYINGKVATLTDCEVIYNKCEAGYNGAGIYVDSQDNIKTGGRFIVTENYNGRNVGEFDHLKTERYWDDLYLQNGKASNAYIHAAEYAPGSKIGIGVTDWKEGQRITFEPGTFNPKVFYCNFGVAEQKKKPGTYYITLNNNIKSKNYRHLVITKSSQQANKASGSEGISFGDKNKTWDTGKSYSTSDGKNYELKYGYTSSPSHTDEKVDIVNKYFYSDGYFFDDPAVYNPHLATFGMNLAMASADSNIGSHDDYTFKFDNVRSMLKGMGCEEKDIYISPSYIVRPTSDSIGVAIGSKTIKNASDGKDYTLVPIAIRSYGYEKEWASNMTIDGKNTKGENNAEHSGFRDARTKVMNAIKSYISTCGLEGQLNQGRVKFFLVGFSRGSATANLTSKALVDTYGVLSDKYKNNPNQVFGYCYAVPSGATDNCDLSLTKNRKAYYCIHNIINQVDLTPLVAPKEMGFKRYGVDHYVPGDDAGAVKSYVNSATQNNGSYKRTTFYDNNSWWTNSSSYAVKKPSMLKQLAMVNDQIHFVDWFKETDLITGKAEGVKSFVKGIFTEASPVKFVKVKNSTATLESWLPEFYKTVQEYNSVGENEKITRKSYSSTVVRAGKDKKLKNGERNWYAKGLTAQDTFRGLVQMMLSKTPSEKAILGAAFSGLGNKLSLKQITLLYEKLINSKKGWDYSKDRQQDYLDLFWNMLKDNRYGQKAIQDAITDPRELAELENYFPSLMSIAFRIVRQDFNDKKHSGKLRLVGTFATNAEAILQGHVPEIALAWLRAYDDYYANEDKAYYWKQNSYSTGTISCKISGNDVKADAYEGSQVLKLSSSSGDDAIYYTIEADRIKSIPMLYNDRQGIVLNAPKGTETKEYKIEAWGKYSYAMQDKVIAWQTGAKTGPVTVKVKAKTVTPEVQTYKVKLQKMKYNGATYVEDDSSFDLDTGVPTRLNEDFDILSVRKFMDEYYPDYLVMYRYVPMIPNPSKTPLKLYPRIKEVKFGQDLIDKVKPETSKKLVTTFADGDKVQVSFTKGSEGFQKFNAFAICNSLKWEERTGENTFTPVKTSLAKPNTEYRAVLNLRKTSSAGFDRRFTDKLTISYGDQSQTLSPYDDRDKTEVVLPGSGQFYKTEKISISGCGSTAEAWAWNNGTEKEIVQKGTDELPVYAGYISAGTKTVSGLEVEWKPDQYNRNGDTITVKGLIKNGEGTKAAEFAGDDYDWGGIAPFEVEGTIHIVSTSKLLPPSVSLPGGSYTFIYDNIPVNDEGNMIVRLSNPNEGVSDCKVTYKLDGGAYTEYKEDTPIVLKRPAEDKTETYNLKVSCNSTEPGRVSSDEIEYTYTLRYPLIRTVKAFTWDINDTLSSVSQADIRFSEEAEKDEEVMVDFDDIANEEDLLYRELVSWNVISGNVVANKTRVPGYQRIIWQKVSDNDVCLMAETAPVLSDINVTLERPSTGEGLQVLPEELRLEIGGEEYDIDPRTVSMNWSASENSADDGIAKSQTTYTATISVNTADLKYSEPGSESGNYLPLELKFLEGEELYCAVNGVTDRTLSSNSAGIDNLYCTFNADEETRIVKSINIIVTFKKSGAATFLMVEPPEGISVSFNAASYESGKRFEDDVKPNLPKTAEVLVDDGSIRSLSVDWVDNIESDIYDEDGQPIDSVKNGIAYEQFGYVVSANDLNTLDAWSLSMNGYVTLPEDVDYLKDEKGEPLNEDIVSENGVVRCYFEYPVDMAGAPESNMPDILPGSGEYDPSTEDLVVEFDTTALGASSNKVDVYYRITGGRYAEEESEDYDFDLNAPVWYDEDGKLVIPSEEEGTYKYIPFTGYKETVDEAAKAAEEDLENRTITRKWADENNFDYAKVTAIALQEGAYRISAMSEAVYEFLPKPTAEIAEETLDELNSLELTSGTSLQTLKLPENCRWSPETDIYEKHTERAGNYIYATVIYNDDPDNFNDLILNTGILITAGTYNISAEGCRVYAIGEEDDETFDPEWPEVTRAQAESRLYVSANAPEGDVDLMDWVVTDSEGNEVDFEYAEDEDGDEDVRYDVIILEMPYSDIRIRPVWFDRLHPLAPVKSLTVAPSYLELKKGGTATITANAVYDDSDEEMTKPEISFVSSDPSVVKVSYSQGTAKVTAVSSGSATIWVDCADKAATCLVSVGLVNVDLQLTDCKAYDITGETDQLLADSAVKGSTIKLVPDAHKNPIMVFKEWTINGANIDVNANPAVFKVQTDIVARAEYTTDPAYEDPGEYAYKNVKIKSLAITDPASKKKITKLTASLNGLTIVDAKAVYKNDTDMPPLVFKSSNTDVAKVKTVSGENPGEARCVIAGCRPGVVTVTAYCGNKTAKLTVTVGDEEVGAIKLFSQRLENSAEKIDGQYVLELQTGEQELLSASPYEDFNTTPIKVTWKSDDPRIATVRNGLVTARIADKGHTTVTAQAKVKPYGSSKWINLPPAKVVVRVKAIEVPKKARNDKSYNLSLKSSQNLDLTAAKIGKKNVISGCTVTAKLKGAKPEKLEWKSTNESIVSVNAKEDDPLSAGILAKGIGTAYVVLEGTNAGSNLTNRAVMKITVKATAPDIEFTNDTLGALSDDYTTLILKQGSYDRLAVNISCPVPGDTAVTYNVSEKITWSGSGGVTVTDGVVFAKNLSKNGKAAKVTVKCGKSKKELKVIVK